MPGPKNKKKNKKFPYLQEVFGGLRYSLMGEVGILANICNRVKRWPARKNNSVFSRRTKRKERLIRDEKESWKDFIEEVNFGLSLKRRSRYSPN